VVLSTTRCAAAEPTAGITLTSVQPAAGTIPESLAHEVNAAIDRGLDWLAANQKEDGSWSKSDFPALTALPLWAFTATEHAQRKAAVEKAVKFILGCVQENGGIYRDVKGVKGGGLSNYNTAICMTALHATGDQSLTKTILAARRFLAGSQHFGDDVYKGGFGYDRDTGRAYTDLMNTYYTVEAMSRTAGVEDQRPKGEKRADIDWTETVKYIERMQNKPESGDENAGGFYYNPSDPKAGASTNAAGVVVFRSYGSITYAGMLALIYAGVTRDDVRVKSALDWSTKHWSLDENPGMGQQGVYFFYNILSKALAAARCDSITRNDGSMLNWRIEMANKLVSLQKTDPNGRGYWENPTGRYWENDPVLTTAYCLLALEALR
jgi:squalene-hopene/tetraprenyl-beta-curcumene cyclase